MADLAELVKEFHLQRVFLYGLIILSSFFVLSPLAELQINFGHQCLLYADVQYHPPVYYKIMFTNARTCDFNIVVAVAFSLIYAAVAAGGYIFLYRKQQKNDEVDIARMWFLIHCVSEVAVLVLVLVSACIISAGFSHLCNNIVQANDQGIMKPINHCSDAQEFHPQDDYDFSNFHLCLSIATAGVWFSFLFWLLQCLFGAWKLWRLNMIYFPDQLKICCKSA